MVNRKLPEKDFFSTQEVAERYSCSLDLIDHYIYEKKILRIAVKSEQLQNSTGDEILGLCKLEQAHRNNKLLLSNIDSNAILYTELDSPTFGINHKFQYANDVIKGLDSDRATTNLPRFLYFPAETLISESLHRQSFHTFIEDFSGSLYCAVFCGPPELGRDYIAMIDIGNCNPIITLEELARFESEHLDQRNNSEPLDEELTPKSKNTVIRTIYALSQHATNGLTGQPNKDANAVIAAL